jgi:hypothetical protein
MQYMSMGWDIRDTALILGIVKKDIPWTVKSLGSSGIRLGGCWSRSVARVWRAI